jgi:hypothetical protein
MVRFLYIANSMALTKADYMALRQRITQLVIDIAGNFQESVDITTTGGAWADYIPTALVLSKNKHITNLAYVFKSPICKVDGKCVFVQGDTPGYSASDYNIKHRGFAGAIAAKPVEGRMSKDKRKAKLKELTLLASSATRIKLYELSTRPATDTLTVTSTVGTVNVDLFDRIIVVDQMDQKIYHTDTVDDDAATINRDSDMFVLLETYKGVVYKININNYMASEEDATAKMCYTIKDSFNNVLKRKSSAIE